MTALTPNPMVVHPYPPDGTTHVDDCDWHMTHDGFDCTCWEDRS